MPAPSHDPPAPTGIGLPHQQPRRGLARHASPLSLLLLGAVVALGLSGLLGRAGLERSVHGQGSDAELSIEMPAVIRTGDLYETRLEVRAGKAIGQLQVDVSAALWRDITVNSMVPAPESERFDGDAFRFGFGPLAAGETMHLKVASQVNPRLFGRLAGAVRVRDGEQLLTEAHRSMRVLP